MRESAAGWNAPLHGLRGVMAMFVVAAHLLGSFLPTTGFHHAVDVFFVLSGFVLCSGFDVVLPFDRKGFRRFLRGRIARLVPVAWLAVASYWSVELLAQGAGKLLESPFDTSWRNLLGNLLFLDGNLPLFASAGPKWSLSNEMVAYLAIFPFAWLLRRRWIAGLVLVLVVMAQTWFAEDWNAWGSLFSRCLPSFLAGCALYHLRIPALSGSSTLLCWIGGGTLFLFGPTLAMASGGVLLVLASSQKTGPGARFLEGRLVQWLGGISYPLYLLHPLAMYPVFLVQEVIPASQAWYPAWAVLPVGGSLLAAHLVHLHLEEPLRRRWGRAGRRVADPEGAPPRHHA